MILVYVDLLTVLFLCIHACVHVLVCMHACAMCLHPCFLVSFVSGKTLSQLLYSNMDVLVLFCCV